MSEILLQGKVRGAPKSSPLTQRIVVSDTFSAQCPNCAIHRSKVCLSFTKVVFSGRDQMAAKHLLCCVLQMMLLCCIAECSTPDKNSTLLGRDAFARAEASINETARPLDRAL